MKIKENIRLFARYPYWARKRCIFIHTPKAAGTSINRALYGRPLGHFRAVEIRQVFPKLFERCFVFSFVRNPWDRVLSAYRFAVKGHTESMGIRRPEQYRIPEFDSFERFLIDWLATRDAYEIDFVFKPQHIFVEDADGKQIVDFVGRVESIEADIGHVESCLGQRLNIAHSNRTGEVGDYRGAYTSTAMVEVVENVYQPDIRKFGYFF